MAIITKIEKILFEPNVFFKELHKEKGIKTAYIYFAALFLLCSFLAVVVGFFFSKYYIALMSAVFGIKIPFAERSILQSLVVLIINYLFGLVTIFVGTGLIYLWCLIFGGKANYVKTFQMCVYSKTPVFVFGWVPVIGLFAWFYELGLLIIGTREIHKISKSKSILMYAIPVALFMLFILIIIIIMLAMIKSDPDILNNLTSPHKE
ncbi:MAG: Yip1 family protein [Nanoarchaeota archaeon]|nr:Yip1 family protein [Nanoarchaeota archaeon]